MGGWMGGRMDGAWVDDIWMDGRMSGQKRG